MAETTRACMDLAGDDSSAKTACRTGELVNAKKAKAEAEGKAVGDINDVDVAKDLERGKEQDAAGAMEACTDHANNDGNAEAECNSPTGNSYTPAACTGGHSPSSDYDYGTQEECDKKYVHWRHGKCRPIHCGR